jgi:hypothetical protein
VEFWQWAVALVVGAAVGGGGQLDLDRTKHRDELNAPKRAHGLQALQRSAAALDDAVTEHTRHADGVVSAGGVKRAKARVIQGKAAVDAFGTSEAKSAYGEAVQAVRRADALRHPQYVVRKLSEAATHVHRSIEML